jgi:uncharacterized glyoxalase superfamily protein PhnB
MADSPPVTVWPILHYDDTEAALRLLVDVLGFRAALVVRDDRYGIAHAELRWPEGGTVLFGSTRHLDGVHGAIPRGASAMYVPTDRVEAVHERALAAGVDIVQPLARTEFGSGVESVALTLRDAQGYLWTFGSYRGAP